jgi:hypothetical protein
MLLPGRLGATTLGDLLGILYRARATGVLELVESSGAVAGRAHRVHLERGLVAHVDTPLCIPRLGEILRRGGFLDASAERRLRCEWAFTHKPIGRVLLAEGLCTPLVLGAALRHQLRARLDALFQIVDARISFHVACPRGAREDPPIPLSPYETLHGRPRRRDGAEARTGAGETAFCRRGQVNPTRARALALLGLEAGADRARVRQAFRLRAVQFHPDRHPRASAAERAVLLRRFSELSAAYHELVA